MKTRIIYLSVLLLSFGCKKDHRLTSEPTSITGNECSDCPVIQVSIPTALGKTKIDNSVNTALREEVIAILNFDEETAASTIENAISSFSAAYYDLKEKYTDESTTWEAKIEGNLTYEDENILTIKLDSYLFTGGAHGYSTSRFLNFDKKKGQELERSELFKDMDAFQDFAEEKFRLREQIPETDPINSTGFMFEGDSFYLPQNIGYTQNGLQLFYEQYEVASYADGPITLTFPYIEIEKFMQVPVKQVR